MSVVCLACLAPAGGLCGAEVRPFDPVPWPEAITPEQQAEDVFGVKLRQIMDMDGAKAATRFITEEMARDPKPYVKAYMAWYYLYAESWGAPELQNPVKGRALAEEAAKGGSSVGTWLLGHVLLYGLGGEKDVARGVQLVGQAAESGNTWAMAQMARLVVRGLGLPWNPKQADRFARRAAELGEASGLIDIAERYEAGDGGYPKDLTKAIQYYYDAQCLWNDDAWQKLKALEKSGVPQAGLYYRIARLQNANDGANIKSPSIMRKVARELAAQAGDNPQALVELARAQRDGYYMSRNYKQARARLEKAVAAEYRPARVFLAEMRLCGQGGPKEPAALADLQTLADQGEPEASAYLGWAYYWGASEVGVKKNETLAFELSRQAAERGMGLGLVNLANCYSFGIGTPKNYALAAKVGWQAYRHGYPGQREDVRRLLAYVKL